ncbi:nuclear transport factor 2 family protein [Actinospica durhamensis]|uniref:Nuclear transport factor 2 family protein n=1 Tax=Actinospica durhamensis TaxID=1508375 RepID=A0A941ELH7_9ACTN|nr:nuclear transport factor 2 family protein [Actinospica durhamensis]MBR7833331.1 nuclear transport factor 2 family protein [Actinospica durhamensis]
MTDDQTSAAVREHVEAFNDGDLERLMAGFAEDALWITGETVVRGLGELRSFFGGAIDGLRPNLAVENLVAQDCRAACQMTETLLFEQEQRSYSIAAFFRLRDGLITSAKVYREGSAKVA